MHWSKSLDYDILLENYIKKEGKKHIYHMKIQKFNLLFNPHIAVAHNCHMFTHNY